MTHITLHTSVHGSTRTIVILFAVAKNKYKFLGTPFLEKYVKTLSIEHTSLGKIPTPFEIRLKPNAKVQTERHFKVPIH